MRRSFVSAAVLVVAAFASALLASAARGDSLDDLKSTRSELYRADVVEFDVEGAKAFVVKPRRPRADKLKPWVWYAPSLTKPDGSWELPSERHARVIDRLLDEGFYFCGVDVGESWGSPAGRETYTKFHRRLVDGYGLDARACLFPVSRGGMMHYNWAAEHPEAVRCIGAIYPVCEMTSPARLEALSKAYKQTPEQLVQDRKLHNPIERLEPLAKAGIVILLLHGDMDKAVPLETNSAELARRYKDLGGQIELIVAPGKGHEFAPEFWENPRLPKFFLEQGTRR